MTSVAPGPRPWFFGPVSDLLLGCGLLYAFLFALQCLAGPAMREVLPYAWLPLLTLVFGAPHYGATLLRVYEQRGDRRKYALFAVHATGLLLVAYVAGLYNVWIGSLLVTVYLTWSPWHYSGQNYGIALLFLRRRGIAVPARAKQLLWGSFVLSYVLTFLVLHKQAGGEAYAPASYDATVYRLLSLQIPLGVHVPLFLAVEAAYLACLAGALWILLPLARARDLLPTGAVLFTQALWFAVPTIATEFGAFQGLEPLRSEHRAYAFMWVAVGHFLQYLWITTFYAASSATRAVRARYLLRTLLVGTALWVFPTLLFAPGALGRLPFDMGLALLTASVVNIHHFVLDGAIWKLRDGRIARVLLRDSGAGDASAPVEPGRRRWASAGVVALGALCWIASLGLMLDAERAGRALREGDTESYRAIYERRAWLGRDSPRARLRLALRASRAGDLATALSEARRSARLYPTVDAYLVQARIHERRGETEAALAACDAALALEPDQPEARRLRERALRRLAGE